MRFNICKKKCNFIFTNLLILFFILLFFYYYSNYKYMLKENFFRRRFRQSVATNIAEIMRKKAIILNDIHKYNNFVRKKKRELHRLQNNN